MVDGSKKIDGLSQVLSFVKTSSVRANDRSARSGRTAKKPASAEPRSVDALNERIAKSVKRNAGSASPEEAGRAVVREVLLWEFGEEFRDHPEFAAIVDRVAEAMADNRRLSRDIAAILSQLK